VQGYHVESGVEELPGVHAAAAAGPAVQEHGGLSVGVAGALVEDLVAVAHAKESSLEGLDVRVQRVGLVLRLGATERLHGEALSLGCLAQRHEAVTVSSVLES